MTAQQHRTCSAYSDIAYSSCHRCPQCIIACTRLSTSCLHACYFCNPILLYLAVAQCILMIVGGYDVGSLVCPFWTLYLQRYQTAQCNTVLCIVIALPFQLHSTHLSHLHDLSTAELQLLTVLQYCLHTLCPHCVVKRLPLLIFSAVLQALHFPIQTTSSTSSNTAKALPSLLRHCYIIDLWLH